MMRRLLEIPWRMLARTAVQPRVLVALIIQCAIMATEVVEVAEVATESEEDVVLITWQSSMKKEKKERISEKRTSSVIR